MVEPVAFGEAAALIGAVRSGSAGADAIPDPPLLVVDLDSMGDSSGLPPESLRPPAIWPCVVIAVSTAAGSTAAARTAATVPPGGADLYLTASPEPPRPWVGALADLDALASKVAEHPEAATTLAQVLRSHTGDVERDLVLESVAYAALQAGKEHRAWLASNPRNAAGADGSPAARAARAARAERSGSRLDIILDRPARHNAFSAAMRDDLVAALELAASDPTITEVHLRGSGPSFCSGGDLSEFGSVADPSTAHQIRMSRSAAYHVHATAARLVAHVHGACIGAGVELPSFARRVEADGATTFRLPEVGMGLIPGAGGTASIPRRIGRSRTAWLGLSGTDLDARTALAWGLVDEIVPAPRHGGAGGGP